MLLSPAFSALSPPPLCVPILCRAARSGGAGWCRHLRHSPGPVPVPVPSSAQPGGRSSHLPREARSRPPPCPARPREAGSMAGARFPSALTETRRKQPSYTGSSRRSSRGGWGGDGRTPRGSVRAASHPERGSAAGASGQEPAITLCPLPLAIAPTEILGAEKRQPRPQPQRRALGAVVRAGSPLRPPRGTAPGKATTATAMPSAAAAATTRPHGAGTRRPFNGGGVVWWCPPCRSLFNLFYFSKFIFDLAHIGA